MKLDDIEATLSAMSPAPWRADVSCPDDCVLWGPDPNEATSPGPYESKFLGNIGCDALGEGVIAFDLDVPNTIGMAALRNAMPVLLEIARAAGQVHNEASRDDPQFVLPYSAYSALTIALAKLEALKST